MASHLPLGFAVSYLASLPCALLSVCPVQLFSIDMFIIFSLIYKDKYTGNWVYKRRTIVCRYLSGWFWIDLFSVLPFYLTDWVLMSSAGMSWSCDIAGQVDVIRSAGSRAAATVKMIRLCRMLKLTRVFKASRVLQRFAQDILMSKLEMSYAVMKVWYLIIALAFVAHWQACLWALVSIYMKDGGQPTWVGAFLDSQEAIGQPAGPWDVYISALYWSVMTLTSIGYGDFYPHNSVERLLSVFYMSISGVTWTYAIGQAAGIAATLDPGRIMYETTMDQLNYYMTERKLPKEMRITLRDYFQMARHVHQSSDDSALLAKMSPLLQGTVALAANKKWVDSVAFLRGLGSTRSEREFIGELAKRLELSAYVGNERVPLGRLYILRCGMIVRMWRFLGAGRVWGEDFLLAPDFEMVDHAQAVALTFCETFSLTRANFDAAAQYYEEPMEYIRRFVKKFRLKRALLNYLVVEKAHGKLKSFVPRSASDGADYTPEMLSWGAGRKQAGSLGAGVIADKSYANIDMSQWRQRISPPPSRPSSPTPASPSPVRVEEEPPKWMQWSERLNFTSSAPSKSIESHANGGGTGFAPISEAGGDTGAGTGSGGARGPLSVDEVAEQLLAMSQRLERQHRAQQDEITNLVRRLKLGGADGTFSC